MSCEESESCPSTEKQLLLADTLVSELRALGLCAERDENGYVYAALQANTDLPAPKIGLIAHMDTAPDAPDAPIRPRTVLYEGGDVVLNEEEGILLSPRDYLALEKYRGEHLIVTDGKTLLGADDKAGIAAIVTAMERLVSSNLPHGDVKVAFTPDEEIGRGADLFDVKGFGCDWAYTVDGGDLGEIEYENFNAASAKITVHGVNIHPGSAKNKMKNAALLAAEFIGRMPAAETPAHTEGYEGFYHLCDVSGDESLAKIAYIIRDHDMAKFTARKAFVQDLVDYMNKVYGEGTFVAEIKDSYYKMREKITPFMHVVDNAVNAMKAHGIEPTIVPIRGGTDGARLSFEGLPCPNLSTGGANFHGIHEFIPIPAMEKMVSVLITLMQN